MSLTAQNSSGPASTSVAERRERRRQKILQNAEDRISKILTAHGGERRQAPTIDGMYGEERADSGGETAPVELTSNGGPSVMDDGAGQCRLVNCRERFDCHRLSVAASFGVLLRLLVHFDLVRSVPLTFLPAFIACQFFLRFRFSNDVTLNAQDSLMTNFLLVCGLNERIVRLGALFFDVFWQFLTDFCPTTFAFLVTHCLIIMLKLCHIFIVSFF